MCIYDNGIHYICSEKTIKLSIDHFINIIRFYKFFINKERTEMKKIILSLCIILQTWALHSQIQSNFTADRNSGCPPFVVNFYDSSASANSIVSWEWDFGNGNKSTLQQPTALYNNPGSYSVHLIIQDSLGNYDTLIKSQYLTVFEKPIADFTVQRTTVCKNDSLQFTNNS